MTTLIIFVIVIAVGFVFRKKLESVFISLIKRRKGPTIEHGLTTQTTFAPAGVVRTFVIALDIEEEGDGKVKISLAKKLPVNKKE
jgi:hypothetical protein